MLNIARILLKNTKIMIFDEILGALNNDSRKAVIDLLNDMKTNHTIIIIDNNENILEISDNIVLLKDSEVIEVGDFTKISNNKVYNSIVNE